VRLLDPPLFLTNASGLHIGYVDPKVDLLSYDRYLVVIHK